MENTKPIPWTHKYYVYIRPGYIQYFDDYDDALELARNYDTEVKEVNPSSK